MKKQILIIDDDRLVLKSVSKLLEANGYGVFTAVNKEEAYSLLAKHKINLIVCDIRMPGVDGLTLMRDLKNQSKRPQDVIPVIFVTGYASEEAPIDAIKLEAKDYILKPFDMDELLRSVEKHIVN